MVLRRAEETDDIAKMPTPPIPSPVYGPPIRSSRPIFSAPMPVKAPQISKPRKTSKSKSRPPIPSTHPTKRATINSLTTHYAPQDLPNLVLPQTHIVVPKPPSRSPTPPTRVVPSARGNKYTEEDKAYFIKFISWHLKCNPELTKAELCAMLAEKVYFFYFVYPNYQCSDHFNRPLNTRLYLGLDTGTAATTSRIKFSLPPKVAYLTRTITFSKTTCQTCVDRVTRSHLPPVLPRNGHHQRVKKMRILSGNLAV